MRYSIIAVLASAAFFGAYLYTRPNVAVVDLSSDQYSSKFGYREGFREEYFSRVFPTATDIEDYWKNSTLVIADSKFHNVVYYFDDDHRFITWIGGILYAYEWALFPEQQLLKLGSQSRSVVIQKFCFRSIENPETTREDNCRLVPETSGLYNRGTSEYRKGDLFGLFVLLGRKQAPFRLPQGPISIESLLTQLPNK